MAFEITQERLNLLNYGRKDKPAKLNVTDLSRENKRGTRVEFCIPYEVMN